MTLSPGVRLGPYQILDSLGAGGMGEVWRARDMRLKRDVALKVMPPGGATDPDRRARFQREAEVLAALNHPNIAAIYGVEDLAELGTDTGQALVLELVVGQTLAERVSAGPLPVDDVLSLARQMCDALDYAHERGVLHRDFKPSNLKLTPDGQLKVLDFGLAKLSSPSSSALESDQTTISPPRMHAGSPAISHDGMLLGTAAYMSPEQARGRGVDRRSDIWAFGCTLFELLSGRRPFEGDTVTDVLAAVVTTEPRWEQLSHAPAPLLQLVRRCLAKEPKARLRDIGDARHEIDLCSERAEPEKSTDLATPRSRVVALRAWVTAATVGAVAVAGWLRAPAPAAPRPIVQVPSTLGPDLTLDTFVGTALALSPDGSRVAYVARRLGEARQLYVRALDQVNVVALAGTEEGFSPFFSPDGQWLAFFSGGKLKKVPATGGPVVIVADAPNGRGGSWGDDDTIVFNPGSGSAQLLRVSAAGGTARPVAPLADGEVAQRWPQMLPGSQAVLFTSATNLGNNDVANLVILSLAEGKRTTVLEGGHFGRVTASGHLAYVREARLMAAAFDAKTLRVVGEPVPVIESLSRIVTIGAAQFSVADNGLAVYLPGGVNDATPLHWLTRDGTRTLEKRALDWSNPRLSPDGSKIALDVFDGRQTDIWVYDVSGDGQTRLTFDVAEDWYPVWSPDGSRIVYRSSADLGFNLYWIGAAGGGNPERLLRGANPQTPTSWHPSGSALLFNQTNPTTNRDVLVLPFDVLKGVASKAGEPRPLLATTADEYAAVFSPDGHWIAYMSNESGTEDLYVRRYGESGGRWLVATNAADPTWSASGNALLFLDAEQRLVVSTYSTDGQTFKADPPRPWSSQRPLRRPRGMAGGDGRAYDIHPDGTRVLATWLVEDAAIPAGPAPVFVVNFLDELRRVTRSTR